MKPKERYLAAFFLVILFSTISCEKDTDPLAPYLGLTNMGRVVVQDSTLSPRVYWSGGYVTVFGVNYGPSAALDSTLRFLVTISGDNMHYPVEVGDVPAGATNIASTFGGQSVTKLLEDSLYTFWVMKSEAWAQLSSQAGKRIVIDPNATASVSVTGNEAIVKGTLATTHTQRADAYVNIVNPDPDLNSRLRFADMFVQETDTSNDVIVSFHVKQVGVTDSLVATAGACIDVGSFRVENVIWEALSVDSSGVKPAYRTKNVIGSPFFVGQTFPQTEVFTSLPLGKIRRGHSYYVWIASKTWDGLTRDTRTTTNYAWIKFNAW